MSRTRGGLEPQKPKYQKFKIKTFDAKSYVQKKVDVIVDLMNKSGESIPQMKIDLYSNKVSNKFAPFTLVLEPTAAENFCEPNLTVEHDGEEIFNPGGKDYSSLEEIAVLKKQFKALIDAFGYTKDELRSLRSESFKKQLGISKMNFVSIEQYSKPRFYSIDSDGYTFTRIIVTIDPIKVFHDMLVDERGNTNFFCDVTLGQKLNDCAYEYLITKKPYNRKSKDIDRMFRDNLSVRMRGLAVRKD